MMPNDVIFVWRFLVTNVWYRFPKGCESDSAREREMLILLARYCPLKKGIKRDQTSSATVRLYS